MRFHLHSSTSAQKRRPWTSRRTSGKSLIDDEPFEGVGEDVEVVPATVDTSRDWRCGRGLVGREFVAEETTHEVQVLVEWSATIGRGRGTAANDGRDGTLVCRHDLHWELPAHERFGVGAVELVDATSAGGGQEYTAVVRPVSQNGPANEPG